MYDADRHSSADAAIEYRGNAFSGALNGRVTIVRHSNGQEIMTFSIAASGALSHRTAGVPA